MNKKFHRISFLPIAVPPTIKKGGRHPDSINLGNSTFPKIAPILPNIIRIDTIIVLRDVGKMDTVELTNAVEHILDMVT